MARTGRRAESSADSAPYDRSALRAAAARVGDTTPADLARRTGIAQPTAWRLWHGHAEPRAQTIAAVTRAYGLTAEELLKEAQA
ncbi:helix-turn-helix domain-containing protein [Streptomyces sp. URMC 129]|uniref:helix-turn-helix domain-containing protein n=1 Tax=Streptomyces sp. URMC 129 TaxID=3423407 RepID=UPI003F1D5BA3